MKYNSLNPKPLCGSYIFRAVIIEHGICTDSIPPYHIGEFGICYLLQVKWR